MLDYSAADGPGPVCAVKTKGRGSRLHLCDMRSLISAFVNERSNGGQVGVVNDVAGPVHAPPHLPSPASHAAASDGHQH